MKQFNQCSLLVNFPMKTENVITLPSSRRLKQPGLPDGLIEKWKAAKSDRQKSFSQISLCVNFRDVYTGFVSLLQSIPTSFPTQLFASSKVRVLEMLPP